VTEHAAAAVTVRPLTPETWDAFAGLAERHNGVWGGCWCMWFHTFHAEKEFSYNANRALKERLVREGRAHAVLVFDGDVAVGWCQFGRPDDLKNIKHRKGVRGRARQPAGLPPDVLRRRQALLAAASRAWRSRARWT